jgi:hypothetical protein
MLIFKTTLIAFFPILFGAAFLNLQRQGVLVVFPVWFIAYIVAGVWLNRFQCPRCGKLYYWRREWKGSIERQKHWRDCHHCGLPQDAEPA